MNDVLGHLRKVALRGDGTLTDSQLLECFLARRDEAAFAALVRRHGPMVLGVCRRVLRNHHDAEDAFQATFLVLARKAGALRSRELVGNWLHGVAYRTALRARAMTVRRRAHEQRVRERPRPDDGWQELLPLLDQELDRLPERYRVAVVLCDLEGMTRREVARQLGVPEGTLSGRLTRARRLLARRLARHGLAVSGGALGAALAADRASAGVTATLAAATARAAVPAAGRALTAGMVPARVVALAEGVVKTMFLSKLKAFVAVAFVLVVGAGFMGFGYGTGAAEPGGDARHALADDVEALRLEVEALRKGLQATRERVKTLENELVALRAAPRATDVLVGVQEQRTGSSLFGVGVNTDAGLTGSVQLNERNFDTKRVPTRSDDLGSGRAFRGAGQELRTEPLTEAEAALKKLRQEPNDKQATEALEKALKWLKERQNPDRANDSSRQR
jgi:RNA polymerase sigma factor (sigma-70 family)